MGGAEHNSVETDESVEQSQSRKEGAAESSCWKVIKVLTETVMTDNGKLVLATLVSLLFC